MHGYTSKSDVFFKGFMRRGFEKRLSKISTECHFIRYRFLSRAYLGCEQSFIPIILGFIRTCLWEGSEENYVSGSRLLYARFGL